MSDSNDATLLTAQEPVPAPAPKQRLLGVPPWLWLLAMLVAYGGFCASRFAPAISCPDANGYWAQGTLLAQEGRTWFEPENVVQYTGMHWLITEEGRYYSRYSAGLPVAIAAVVKTFGYRASVMLNPFFAVLALAGTYFLAKRLAGARWALLAPLFLAFNPTFARHALQNDSHMSIVCLLAWGLALLLAWSETGSLWRLFVGAVLLGAIPAIRYPEVLFGLGIGTFLIWRSLDKRRPWLHWLVGGTGAILPLIPLMIHNHRAFGAFWNTAYSLTNEQTGFGWGYFKDHVIQYLTALQGDGLGVVFALGVGAIGAMCAYRKRRAEGVLFLLLIVPITLLYMAYYWAPRMMGAGTMRFLLPTFVCYAAAATWALARLAPHVPRPALATAVSLLVGLYAVWGGVRCVQDTRRDVAQRRALARVTDTLEQHAAEDAVVVASSQLLQHLNFVGKWRLVESGELRGGRGGRRGPGRNLNSDAPSPMQPEKRRLEEERYGGLSSRARMLRTGRELKEWAGDGPIYLIGDESELALFRRSMIGGCEFEEVARVTFPEAWRAAVAPPTGGGMGGDAAPRPGNAREVPQAPGEPRPTAFGGVGGGGARGDRFGPAGGQTDRSGGRQGMDRRPVFPGQDGRGGRGMDRRNAPSGDRRMEGGLGGMDGMGGRPGGMGARRTYPLSCEELLIVRVIPRN
ncbi:MAG: hypothetical protein HN380_07440 [Victivallales bacterium]|nr:hypothetical protein [Victivallales bacterium]